MKNRRHKRGFTLIEMSVVLAIIALVAGGVLIGSELIAQAGIRNVIGEYDHYLKATQEFQDKYQALPGDMNNAEDYWDTASVCPTLVGDFTTATCNGNGDGQIGGCADDLSVDCSDRGEIWEVWKHLGNAALIDGRYTGASADLNAAVIGSNVPASKRTPAGWSLLYYTNPVDVAGYLQGDTYGHVFMFGGSASGKYTTYPVLPVLDTLQVDRKIDDGKPQTGKLRAWENGWIGGSQCVNTGSNAYYTCTGETCVCSFVTVLGF